MHVFNEWTSVVAENDDSRIKAEVWNRKIELDKSVFPTSVKINDEEILHAPITLTAEFGDIKGEWTKQQIFLTSQSEESASYAITQTAENLIVNANVTIEFDGLIKTELRLTPFWCYAKDNVPRLTKLYIDIPVKKKYSTYMHFWPNSEKGVCLSARVLNSCETPKGNTMLPFKPYVWTGWEYGGIGICCESDNGFELENPWECITVTSDDEYTNIHIAILDNMPIDWQGRKEDWGNNLNAICYTFGIQATPVKPKKKDSLKNWRVGYCHFAGDDSVYRKVDGNGDTFIEEMYAKGVRAIILHENWSLIQNYGFPKNDQRLKQFVDDCHMLGMKVIPYFGYEVSSLYPDFSKERDNFLNKNVKGNSVGGWQRPPMQRAFIACYKGGYSDVLIERVKYVMDNYGFDGIYTDGTYVPWECANETHGCGYRDRNGNLKHVYPIFAVREHVKKLYAAVHERGGIIDTHQSSCCLMATLAFADSYQDGENIQPMIQESVENMKMDTFRAEYTGLNMGLAANFIAYTAKDATIERLAGIGLLHNVYPRARIDDLDYMSAIWRVLDKFDFLQAKWVPYWENKNIITENEKTYITYYEKEDALLIILVNYNKNADKIRVKLDKKYSSAFDELDNNNEIILTDDIMILPVKYADLMMIGVKSI